MTKKKISISNRELKDVYLTYRTLFEESASQIEN